MHEAPQLLGSVSLAQVVVPQRCVPAGQLKEQVVPLQAAVLPVGPPLQGEHEVPQLFVLLFDAQAPLQAW